MYLVDIDTVVANLTGIPAMSVPAGFADGLPVGLQVMADKFAEQTMLDVAYLFERAAEKCKGALICDGYYKDRA